MNLKIFFICGVAIVAVAVIVLWLASSRQTGSGAAHAKSGRHSVATASRSSTKKAIPVAQKSEAKHKELLSVKIVGGQQARPVAPDDITAFNAAVDAGETVEAAAKKCFPEGVDTDGILAALKLMSQSKDAKTRGGVYKAMSRLFTDVDDLGAAVATAQALLSTMPSADDGSQEDREVKLSEDESESNDDRSEFASKESADTSSSPDVVDDSEADPETQAEGESDIPITAEVEPMCDGVQGDAIDKLLKDGVSDADAEVRKEALAAASQMEDHFRYGAYEEALKGDDSALKKDVLELCSAFGREEDVAVQQQALNDADPDVAAAAQKNLDSDAAKAFLEADAAAKAEAAEVGVAE